MKLFFILPILFCFQASTIGQQPFILSLEQPELDFIVDVVHIGDRFYFLEGKATNIVPPYDYDGYSDLFITSDDGTIIEQVNLNGFRTVYERILKVVNEDIYLVGYIKSDSCRSSIIISKFNIHTHTLDHLSSYDFCDNTMMKIKIVPGLSGQTFIEEIHSSGSGLAKHIYALDSTYSLTLAIDSISVTRSLSVDFSRTGYLIATSKFYSFYDADFNFIKQIFKNDDISYINETHQPFGRNLILKQTIQPRTDWPDPGIQIRLIDSNIIVKKKTIIYPMNTHNNMLLPFFGGLDIKNENEIWASGYFEPLQGLRDGFYFIAKLDSNLNIICQHFIGYDSKYRIYGINTFDSGGAIVYGSRIRDGLDTNEGEDIYAIRVGENCELPAIVSTNGTQEPLISISAYPNPGINDLTFSINGFDPATLQVELIDELGQVLFTAKDLTNSIAVPELPAGQYFYRIMQKERLLGVGSWVKE